MGLVATVLFVFSLSFFIMPLSKAPNPLLLPLET